MTEPGVESVGVVLLAESTALGSGRGSVDDLIDVVAAAVRGGIRTVIVRDKHRGAAERRTLVAAVRDIVEAVPDGTVIAAVDDVHDDDVGANHADVHLGAHGVHLSAAAAKRLAVGPLAGVDHEFGVGPWGVSCHDVAELRRAEAIGADHAMVSPVYETASKPGYGPALGPDGLAALVAAASLPVVALGGIMSADQIRACVVAGATGVAVMGAILRAADPESTAAELTEAFTTGRQLSHGGRR